MVLCNAWAGIGDKTAQPSYLVNKEEVAVRKGLQSSALLLLLLMFRQVFFQLQKQQTRVVVDLRRGLIRMSSIP